MASKKPHKPIPHNEPTPESRSPAEIIAAARQMLSNAERGLVDIDAVDASRRIPGLHNVAVFGRAVTIALQRLRSVVDGFDDWYEPLIPEKDPTLTYFNDLRNQILKQGTVTTLQTSVDIEHYSGNPMGMLQGPPPANATGMFIGEGATGGSGWTVLLPDGSEGKYYAALSPAFRGNVTAHLPNAPTEFLGEPLGDTSVNGVARRYVEWLRSLVAEAAQRFSP